MKRKKLITKVAIMVGALAYLFAMLVSYLMEETSTSTISLNISSIADFAFQVFIWAVAIDSLVVLVLQIPKKKNIRFLSTNVEAIKSMSYAEALDALDKGFKVKLPEWGGYWFKDGDSIKVFTKDGDILDTPWINIPEDQNVKHREDWQITDGRLGFDFVIRALKNGKKVARNGWNGKGMYVFLIGEKGLKSPFCTPYWTYTNGVNDNLPLREFAAIKSVNEEVVPWAPSQSDMLAEDWELAF